MLLLLLGFIIPIVSGQSTPAQMVAKMGVGINLGNTLDAPHEGDWAPAAQESFFDAYKQRGFKHVRIPIRWDLHIGNNAPYTIDENFMNRVEQVVGWSLNRGFITIINSHHDDWLDSSDFNSKLPRFKQLWNQTAQRFKNKPETLLFEIFNEPHVMNADNVNTMNAAILPIIRASNPTRIVLYGGLQWMNPNWIINNPDSMKFPKDPFVMLEVHSYDPYDYTKHDPTTHNFDPNVMSSWTSKLKSWSHQKNISVLLGEFGVTHDQNEGTGRSSWYKAVVQDCKDQGFAFCVWDDNGWFQVYHRDNGQWDEDVMKALFS